MSNQRPCNNKKCKDCKKGVCRNRKFKSFNDCIGCDKRVICICCLEDSLTIKTEVEVECVSMTLEHCADCGIDIKSYPTKPLEPPYQRLKTLIEVSLKKAVKDRKIAEDNNDQSAKTPLASSASQGA